MGRFQEKAGCFHVSQHYAKQQLRCKGFHGNQAGTLVQLRGGVGVLWAIPKQRMNKLLHSKFFS
jgi:hypothetical protein